MTARELVTQAQVLESERDQLFNQLINTDYETFHTESLDALVSLIKDNQLNALDVFINNLGNLFEVNTNDFESVEKLAVLFGYACESDFFEDYTIYNDKNYTLIVKNSFGQI